MTEPRFKDAILSCIANGERLVEDADWLLGMDRFPTTYALSIIAQEELSKALLLGLVDSGALPWSSDVQRALRDHRCKQLAGLVLDYLVPDHEEFLRRLAPGNVREPLPAHVVDAINLLVHERIPRESGRWWRAGDPPLERLAKDVADGKLDQRKQDALYVGVGGSGQVTSEPARITREVAETELERAKRFHSGLRTFDGNPHLPIHIDSTKLVDLLKVMTQQISVEEFNKRWPSL